MSPLCECSRGALHHSSELLKRYLKPSAAEWIHFLLPLAPGPVLWHYRVTPPGMTQEKNTEQLLPAHFTPWAMRPHMKLAQYSHQCGPLKVCTWKTGAERKIIGDDPTISQTSVSMHVNSAQLLFIEGTTCSVWKFPFIMKKRTKTEQPRLLQMCGKLESSILSHPEQQNWVCGGLLQDLVREAGTALLPPLGIPLFRQESGHKARLLQQLCKSSLFNFQCPLLWSPLHKALCEMGRGLQDFTSHGKSQSCQTKISVPHRNTVNLSRDFPV